MTHDITPPNRHPRRRPSQPSAAQGAAEGIKSFIRAHHLHPGDPLPTEVELCAELGCSRSSIREAVRTLASLDIVEVRHGYGTFVSEMSLDPLVEGMVFRTVLDADKSSDHLVYVVETRKALDLAVGPRLCGAVDAERIARLRGLVARMGERARAGESFAPEDRSFHSVLLAAVDNPVIQELSDALWRVHMQVIPIVGVPTSSDVDKTVAAHGEILDAIVADDPKTYAAAIDDHYCPLVDVLRRASALPPGRAR